ncbi:ORF-145 [Teiidae poxvirus 1]|nr:ORF-145 [Teiidae poxvirus 1]
MDTFSIKLFRAVYFPGKPFCFSPQNIRRLLRDLLLGSSGIAKEQLEALLDPAAVKNEPIARSKYLLFGSLILAREGLHVYNEFISKSKFMFGTEFERFTDETKAEEAVRAWLCETTYGLIEDMKINITDETKLIMLDTLYFKANWENSFNPNLTTKTLFHKYDGSKTYVDMMNCEGFYFHEYNSYLQANIILMNYTTREYLLLLLLPISSTGIDRVEELLTTELVDDFLSMKSMEYTDLYLYVPKFMLKEETDFRQTLIKLGCDKIFQKGSLLGISEDTDLHLSEVKQKTTINVDEKGTEGASASATLLAGSSLTIKYRIKADKPFLGIVVCSRYRTPLFVFGFYGD